MAVQVFETSGRFRVTGPPVPFAIPAGAERIVNVGFSPSLKGDQTAKLAALTDDPGQPRIELTVAGTGVDVYKPEISVAAATMDFGSVKVAANKDLAVVLLNRGPAPLTVRSLASSDPAFIASGLELPATLAAAEAAAVNVRFQPPAAGSREARLTIASDDPLRPSVTVTLRGAGAP